MALTNIAINKASPKNKPYRLYDEKGLYLEVTPAGGKLWRLKYRFGGKEKRLAMGAYPEISLKAARAARDEAKALLANNIDPSEFKKSKKLTQKLATEGTFEHVALQWHSGKSRVWSEIHSKNVIDRLTRDVFPFIGKRPINEISAAETLHLLRRIESREAFETAHRVLGNIKGVYQFAIASGMVEKNIARDLKDALQPVKKGHLASTTEPRRVGELLRMLNGYSGTSVVQSALKLAPLTFVRPGELRTAKWSEFDLQEGEWRFIASKTRPEHIVPLSRQAIEVLNNLYPITGTGEYVFPNRRDRKRPMSNNAVLAAMRRMEIGKEEMCGHGFRATARTILDEQLHFRPDIIEHQLAHQVRDPLGRAYNRTTHLPERKEMMQAWADYLDELTSKS